MLHCSIHLLFYKSCAFEIVHDLSSPAFIASLRRFISRRGRPEHIYCDNATNFVGARRELAELHKKLYEQQSTNSIFNYCSSELIQWHFIPPRSPHFGGLWESAVKMCKHHLKRVFFNTNFTVEELLTVVAQIECCLNSRPITAMSSDPSDLSALTPGHFLIGSPLNALPEVNLSDTKISYLTRWQRLQRSVQIFWTRWSKEYLLDLQKRYKWQDTSKEHLVGSLVMMIEDNLPPAKWVLGRIKALHPGKDGLTRVVTIHTPKGDYVRSTNRICSLPLNNNNEDQWHI